jgi:O-phospho-L-seryl-tRNASec:L-selenocysteinyl-tRNA synthase
MPQKGLSANIIKHFINYLSLLDSNNSLEQYGVGEREGRIYSTIIKERSFGLAHGIGRSGNLTELQPKAPGSSTLYKFANRLVKHALKIMNYGLVKDVALLPLATGMSIMMCLLTMREKQPSKKYVIFSRIDQKSCIKSIMTSGLIPIIVDQVICKDEVIE